MLSLKLINKQIKNLLQNENLVKKLISKRFRPIICNMNKLHIVYASLLSLIVVSNGMDAHSKQNNEVPPLSSDGLLKQKPNIAASTTIDQKATLPGNCLNRQNKSFRVK